MCRINFRERNQLTARSEERCHWFTFTTLWRSHSPSDDTNAYRLILNNDNGGGGGSGGAMGFRMMTECRFYLDCPNIAPCTDCVSGHQDCINRAI